MCGGVSCDCRRQGADEFTLYAHALCVVVFDAVGHDLYALCV